MDVITGFVTDVTGEKRGPSKHYRRFDVLTSTNERISGWVFSTTEIDQTYAGDVLLKSANKNSAVCLHGKISSDAGGTRTIKISINNKFDKCINWSQVQIVRPDNVLATAHIEDVLLSNTPSRLECVVIDENQEITFLQHDKQRRYKVYIIGDESGTSPLLVYDELIDSLKISESFIFTQIKSKKIHGKMILTTSTNSTITQSTHVSKSYQMNF
ncbi:unnamed protein product [Rotaria sp. Silwood2]|nr:unnamed protein product [Rotaria sp. Silwood2]CAF3311137.1 unnamed protein product [Rotaria sp. Silwood2]CAF4533749.1 unnamed protein product [Rotaria sp. Silwood2]